MRFFQKVFETLTCKTVELLIWFLKGEGGGGDDKKKHSGKIGNGVERIFQTYW